MTPVSLDSSEHPPMAGDAQTGRVNDRFFLRLITFGGPALILGSSHRSLSPLQGALLGLLASEPDESVSVGRAIDLLWKPAPPDRLRHRISQLVYSLNRGFSQPVVVKTPDRYCLGASIGTDYRAMEDTISNGQPEEAAELFRRGFLSELTTPPTDAFSDWLDAKRLELRAQIRQASVEQWTRLTHQGRWRWAVAPARALLSLDPDDERALRMLMRARAMSGRVREAEAAFLSFVEREELADKAWAPDAETLSLLKRTRTLRSKTGTGGVTRFESQPPLVGRDDELSALSAAMFPRPADGLRLIIIRGERGAGKTRLVEEALARGLLTGVRVLRSRSSEFERGILLNSILDALATPDVASDIPKLPDRWRSTVHELLPELSSGQDAAPTPTSLEPDRVPRRWFEAIRQLLLVITKSDPTIFFIDDFHWVDPTSVAALRYVGRRWPSLPLAVVLAVQTECLQRDDHVSRFLADPRMECEPTELELAEISVDAAHELVEALAETPIAARTRDRIVELSDQNPLFILELARQHLAGRGLPRLDADDILPLPLPLARVFAGRLARLDDDAERALNVLSVCGHPKCARQLSKLAGLSTEACVEALERLQRCRLVSWRPHGFIVRYKLIRHAVYGRMSLVRRTWVHGQVARDLEKAESESTPRELAMHYHRARMRGRALQHALSGARLAEESQAVAEAAELLALAGRNTDDPLERAKISIRLARLHYLRRDPENAPSRLAEAALRLRQGHRPQSALVAEIQRIDMLAITGNCSPGESAVQARACGRNAEQASHWRAYVKAVDLELQIHRRGGQAGKADALIAHVREHLDQVELRSRGSLHASLALHHAGDFDAAVRHVRKAIHIARRTRAPNQLLRALGCLLAIQGVRGLIGHPEATSAAEEGESLGAESDDFVERFNLLANVGTGYLAIGLRDRARNWFAKAETALAQVHMHESHVALACKLGELALAERELEEAVGHFSRAQDCWTPAMGPYLGVISHSGAGLAAVLLGHLDRARTMETRLSEAPACWFADPSTFVLFKAKMNEWCGLQRRAADLISETAQQIETSQPAPWAKLKFEEARVRLRHSLPLREETADEAVRAATHLGIDRWVQVLEAMRRRGS